MSKYYTGHLWEGDLLENFILIINIILIVLA